MPCQEFSIERDLSLKLIASGRKPFISFQRADSIALCFKWGEEIKVPEYIIEHANRMYENNQIRFEDVERWTVKLCIQEGICYHPIENVTWEQLGKDWNLRHTDDESYQKQFFKKAARESRRHRSA